MNITELLLQAGMDTSVLEKGPAFDESDYSVSDMYYEDNNDILAAEADLDRLDLEMNRLHSVTQ